MLVVDSDNDTPVHEAIIDIMSRWPDNTIHWISIELPVTINATNRRDFSLVSNDDYITNKRDQLTADNPPAFNFELAERGAVLSVLENKCKDTDAVRKILTLRPYIIGYDNTKRLLDVVQIVDDSPYKNHHQRVQLSLSDAESTLAELTVSVMLDIYHNTGLVEAELCIHNPAAAHHVGGLWDINDPSSIHFHEIGFEIDHPQGNLRSVQSVDEDECLLMNSSTAINVEQFSSHRGCGWRAIEKTSSDGFCEIAQGRRINPIVKVELPNAVFTLHVPRFWQEHPSALRLASNQSVIALFAEQASGLHELQPGERKRRRITLHMAVAGCESNKWLANRLQQPTVTGPTELAKEHFHRAVNPQGNFDEALISLIVSPQEFFAKRDCANEYGWRNFGEVFADHENLYRKADEPLMVSHYNNQYDLVLGFGLQFLRTKDQRWYELMDDLARHVADIDVYHTDEDRVEYNHGLFWHTNHYQDAGTATHRTFSKLNYDPNDPAGSSGGPGPEHCYTSGLALHYLLTGDLTSRDVVMSLARWMQGYFDGDDALLGRLHSIAKQELPNLVGLVRRKDRASYTYPLTRATGNLIIAFLDAHLLTGDRKWLDAVEAVLVNTFHPDDDVNKRNLDNVEITWSHTVFLQAVLRYMATKESIGEKDAFYEFTRAAFLTYAKWTLEFACPYLEKPEILEFVNDTWAAQDIRRYILMVAAAAYDHSASEAYLAKAEQFSDHLLNTLRHSETLHFSRIQAIIMQNMGIASLYCERPDTVMCSTSKADFPAKKRPSIQSELLSALTKLAHGFRKFDVQAEIRWVRTRR